MTNNELLAKASPIKLGRLVTAMEAIAQRHATAMSRTVMSHAGLAARMIELAARVPEGRNFGEVVAHAWGVDRDGAIKAFWAKWRASPPHWAILNSGNIFGLAMAESRRGFFACGIVGTK